VLVAVQLLEQGLALWVALLRALDWAVFWAVLLVERLAVLGLVLPVGRWVAQLAEPLPGVLVVR
jgi:hypothetical protein